MLFDGHKIDCNTLNTKGSGNEWHTYREKSRFEA